MEIQDFYSHGKLLISGEYAVLDGAKALAVPTKYGQHMQVRKGHTGQIHWKSFSYKGDCWLDVVLDIRTMRLVSADFTSELDGNEEKLAEDLRDVFVRMRALNSEFLKDGNGYAIETRLEFPRNWGLGSSSTLIYNLANWGSCDPYELLDQTFGGSGYDIACAHARGPIFFSSLDNVNVEPAAFVPLFKDHLFFVHLNRKQSSREAIKAYKSIDQKNKAKLVERISDLSDQMVETTDLKQFQNCMADHEALIGEHLGLPKVQKALFPDYFGQTKSLGAWGGDFILAAGNEESPEYFKKKGFNTVIPFVEMLI